MLVVFVRRSETSPVETAAPQELAALASEPNLEVAARETGPFVPIARAPENPAIRDLVVRTLAPLPPTLARFRRARPWLLLGLFPVLALIDLERQLVSLGTAGVAGRLAADVVILAFMIFEIARPIPRHPRTWALASLAVAARYAYMIAAMCGHGLPLFFLGFALSLIAALLAMFTMPSALALERAARDALKVGAIVDESKPAGLALPFAAAIAFPIVLAVARALGAGLVATAAIFVVVGGALSFVAPTRKRPTRAWPEIASAAAFGLASAITLVRLVHYATLAATEIARCASGLVPSAASVDAHDDASTRYAFFLAAMAVLVVPIVEERLYRATLQRALRTRLSKTKAIAISSVVFGAAHVGVYGASIHQTILLGVAFGAAFEEAGLVSAIAAHALYNASQLF